MKASDTLSWRRLGRKLRAQFITGIFVAVPIGITILILIWIFSTIDNILQPIVRNIWGDNILPGVGFATTILLIYLTGVIATNLIGRRLIGYGESLLAKVPLVRPLYSGIKQILLSLATPGKTGSFMRVVLVEFPRKDMRAIGFVTSEITDGSGENWLNILIPTAPNPTSGFLQIVREKDIIPTNLSVDDALKMIVSAGKIMPKGVSDGLSAKD